MTDWLFTESAAGIQVSGDSGSGKSNVLELFAQYFAQNGLPFALIDPDGTTTKQAERFVWGLPPRLRRNFLVIRPTDLRQLVTINPLYVPGGDLNDLAWKARLITKVGHTSHILLSAWGETDFNSRPRMYTWITRILKTLATCGLTLPDARYFLDVGSPLYEALIRAVPDLVSRHAFENLADRRPTEIDDQIESTRTRILGLLENPVVEASLGRADALDFQGLIADGISVIVDLEPHGLLREEDQTILANLFLAEFIHAVMNMPAAKRRPYFVMIDELPVFATASGPLLTHALCRVRKYLARFVFAHQGTQRFPERTDDPFLNTIVSQCGVRVYMRHVNPKDASFFGDILALPSLDPMKIKHVQRTPMQFTEGHELVILTDTSVTSTEGQQQGTSQTAGTSNSTERGEGLTEADGATSGTSTQRDQEDRLRKTVNEARTKTSTRTSNTNTSSGTTTQNGSTSSTNTSKAIGTTRKQTLVPRIVTKDIVTGIQFFSVDEQRQIPASKLAGCGPGEAFVHVSGRGVAKIQFPLAKDPFPDTPKFALRMHEEFWRQLLSRPEYTKPESILAERRRMLDQLLLELQRLSPGESLPLVGHDQCRLTDQLPPSEGDNSEHSQDTTLPPAPPMQEPPDAPWGI